MYFLGSLVGPRSCCFGASSLLCSLSLRCFVGLPCALVVGRGMFVPSLCGVVVLVSAHLRLRVSWKYWGAWGGSIVPYSVAGGDLAFACARFVSPVLLLWLLLLFCLGYSFGWPGCAFVCWLCFSLFFPLSLSAPCCASVVPRVPLGVNVLT